MSLPIRIGSYNKHRNIRVTLDGYKFDSKHEANRYLELKLSAKQGIIKKLILQPKFPLLESFTDSSGIKHREMSYIADFSYIEIEGTKETPIIEDCKGMLTDVYKIKKKFFLYKYPYYIFRET